MSAMKRRYSASDVALAQFNKAIGYLDLDEALVEYLRLPKREFIVNFPSGEEYNFIAQKFSRDFGKRCTNERLV